MRLGLKHVHCDSLLAGFAVGIVGGGCGTSRNHVSAQVVVTADAEVAEGLEYPVVLRVEVASDRSNAGMVDPDGGTTRAVCDSPGSPWVVEVEVFANLLGRCDHYDGDLVIVGAVQPLNLSAADDCTSLDTSTLALDQPSLAQGQTSAWPDKQGCGVFFDEVTLTLEAM